MGTTNKEHDMRLSTLFAIIWIAIPLDTCPDRKTCAEWYAIEHAECLAACPNCDLQFFCVTGGDGRADHVEATCSLGHGLGVGLILE